MQPEQETMLALDAPAQGLTQRSRGGSDFGMRQRRQFGRVSLAVDQRLDHRSAAAPHHVGKYRLKLDVGFLQCLLNAPHMVGLFAHQLLAGS